MRAELDIRVRNTTSLYVLSYLRLFSVFVKSEHREVAFHLVVCHLLICVEFLLKLNHWIFKENKPTKHTLKREIRENS